MNEAQVAKEMLEQTQMLEHKYKKYIAPLREAKAKKGEKLNDVALSLSLNNLRALDHDFSRFANEATASYNVGSFIQHGYDLVMTIYSNLVANNLVSMQPLQYRAGEVWYYDLVYETTKGSVTAEDPALSAKYGTRVNKYGSSEWIDSTPAQVPDGALVTFTGTIGNAPLRKSAGVYFNAIGSDTALTERFDVTDDSATIAILTGDLGGSGTVNTDTGAYSITFNTAPLAGAIIQAKGKINFENKQGTAQMRTGIRLVSEPIYSEKHQLISRYSLDAEYDLQRQFGRNISDDLIKGNADIIKAEVDQWIMCDIRDTAKNPALSYAASTWDGAVTAGMAEVDHFRSLLSVFRSQSNQIYDGTRMVQGNFVITGNSISTILEILPEYRPNPAIGSELGASGPYVGGTIAGMMHIKNPEFETNEWVVGNRGQGAFNTGYVVGTYKPLMVTDPIPDANDVFSRVRGLWVDLGRKVVNTKFYSYGSATNLPY